MKPDIESLLTSLRASSVDHPELPQLEHLLWQRLEARETPSVWRRLALPLRVTAIIGAFVWGIVIGLNVAHVPKSMYSGELLVEQAEFLAPLTDDLTH
jgi:hypothetical protein